jgi:hypothetical protein
LTQQDESLKKVADRVTGGEITAGTETEPKSMSPADVVSFISQHEAGETINPTAQSTNYTAVAGDLVLMTTGASDKTVDLPAAASNNGAKIRVKKVDADVGNVIIDGNLAETIDGSTTVTIINQWTSYTLYCDGTEWYII